MNKEKDKNNFDTDIKFWDELINNHENIIDKLISQKELCNSRKHKYDKHYFESRIEQEIEAVCRFKNQRQNRISTYGSVARPAAGETE